MVFEACQENHSGMALVMVLIFSSTLLLLGTALLTYSLNEKIIADYQEEEIRLYYITEAGLEAGLAALRRDFFHREQISGDLNGGLFRVDFITHANHQRSIMSEGTLGRYRKTLTIVAEHDLSAHCESLAAENIYLRRASVYGNVHVNQQLWAEEGECLISGKLYYRDGRPPFITPDASLHLGGPTITAEPMPKPSINFEQLAEQTTRVIPGGLLRQPPAEYPAHTNFLVEGDLVIAPQAEEIFNFSGLLYVQGDLIICPDAESTLLIEGALVAEGCTTLQPHATLNIAEPGRNLILLSGGEIALYPAENTLLQIGGTQIIYSPSAIRLQGENPDAPLIMHGVYITDNLWIENCTLHYEPLHLQKYAKLLPGLGQIKADWVNSQ